MCTFAFYTTFRLFTMHANLTDETVRAYKSPDAYKVPRRLLLFIDLQRSQSAVGGIVCASVCVRKRLVDNRHQNGFCRLFVSRPALIARVKRVRRRYCYRSSVCPSVCHASDPHLNGSRHQDMIYIISRCLRTVVLPSVTLWFPSLNPVVGRYGAARRYEETRIHMQINVITGHYANTSTVGKGRQEASVYDVFYYGIPSHSCYTERFGQASNP